MLGTPSESTLSQGLDATALRQLAAEQLLPMRVVGESMAPTLINGEMVAVKPSRYYLPGDIIAFRQTRTGRLLVHRVLGYRRTGSRWALVVQGDASSTHDGPAFAEEVVGKVRHRHGCATPLVVPVADRFRALGQWGRLVLSWVVRRLP